MRIAATLMRATEILMRVCFFQLTSRTLAKGRDRLSVKGIGRLSIAIKPADPGSGTTDAPTLWELH
jgi:hypothetical protein